MTYGLRADAIVGYTFRADIYCPACVMDVVDPNVTISSMNAEGGLAELALLLDIDRMDEYSYDSDAFPKVIFASDVEDAEYCGRCNSDLD